VLAEAGWSRAQIRDGLARFANVDFAVPVPKPRPELSARDVFMYLLMFAALYLSAYQLGNLAFQLINLAFPDQLSPFANVVAGQKIRWATATLIVAFPVFLFVASRIARDIAEEPARRNSAVRRWLTYLTLFVAATVLIGDTIALIFNLLNGELTVRFVLKAVVVALIAGSGFGYYLWSSKADDEALAR
jgi:hypothetical protein